MRITENKNTPLILAAALGNLDIVKILMRHKADYRIRDKAGKTAFQYALLKRHNDVVKYFLHNGYVTKEDTSQSGLR